jgi:5-methylcytosine-specific restriction enzyme A
VKRRLAPCAEHGCPELTRDGRCEQHKRKAWEGSTRSQHQTISGSANQKRRRRILEALLYTCHVCGKTGADQVDHVVPLGEGGADEDYNLAPIHAEPCHREKTADEARRARVGGAPGSTSRGTGLAMR